MSKEEWYSVCLKVRPDLTQAEFDRMWNEFIRARERRGEVRASLRVVS